jgi:hypothetical protein
MKWHYQNPSTIVWANRWSYPGIARLAERIPALMTKKMLHLFAQTAYCQRMQKEGKL